MHKLSDKQVEIFIGHVLRTGVLLSSCVTALGIFLYLLHSPSVVANYGVFDAARGQLPPLGVMLASAFHGNAIAIIQVGILLLIATPVARVAFLVGSFGLERDRMYVVVSVVVLVILLYSIVFS